MKNMMKIFLFAAIAFTLISCATKKSFWTSTPELQMAENEYYKATITPLKDENKFYVSFRLDVVNKYSEDLEIDWNKTKYILNNSKYGVFVFNGIKPKDIKNLSISGDIIASGTTFSKDISPQKMVARSPVRSNSADNKIIPGILPNGENGVYLVVRLGSKEIAEKLSITIKENKE
jgi:hypothetical protein